MIVRIRQIRPEFFTDPVTGHLSPVTQVTYIGLWCVADDAGWLTWDVSQLGALLSPYKSIPAREKVLNLAAVALSERKRLIFYSCGCAWLPKLADHQRIGGNKAFPGRDAHRVHTGADKSIHEIVPKCEDPDGKRLTFQEVHTSMDKSARNVTVSNVTVGAPATDPDGPVGAGGLKDRVAAHGYKPS